MSASLHGKRCPFLASPLRRFCDIAVQYDIEGVVVGCTTQLCMVFPFSSNHHAQEHFSLTWQMCLLADSMPPLPSGVLDLVPTGDLDDTLLFTQQVDAKVLDFPPFARPAFAVSAPLGAGRSMDAVAGDHEHWPRLCRGGGFIDAAGDLLRPWNDSLDEGQGADTVHGVVMAVIRGTYASTVYVVRIRRVATGSKTDNAPIPQLLQIS